MEALFFRPQTGKMQGILEKALFSRWVWFGLGINSQTLFLFEFRSALYFISLLNIEPHFIFSL